jgi:microcystin-dependent protein
MIQPPRNGTPDEMHRWAIGLVQQLQQKERLASGTVASSVETGGSVPAGSILMYGGADAPAGWLVCVGQLLERNSFPQLFSAVGTRWNTGGEDETLFRLPDGRGKFAKGYDGDLTGGASELTLGLEHLPEASLTVTDPGHTHEFTGAPHTHGVTDAGHVHTLSSQVLVPAAEVSVATGDVDVQLGTPAVVNVQSAQAGVVINNATAGGTNSTAATGIGVELPGGGEPLTVEPPYVGLHWIIKT